MKLILNWCPCIPHRHYVCILGFLGLTISYIMRFCLSMALTEMVQRPKHKIDPDACATREPPDEKLPKEKEFKWSGEEQGRVNAAFFWGYTITLIPGGLTSEKLGAKITLEIFIGITSILCFITPIIARTLEVWGMIVLRFCMGLAQGFVYASLHDVVAAWVPKFERGLWGSVVFSGAHSGNALNSLLSALLIGWTGRWDIVFYVWGIFGLVWTVLYGFTTYAFPNAHPNMKPKEKEILDAYLAEIQKKETTTYTPWKEIFKSNPVWAINICMFGHSWALFMTVTSLPLYFSSVMRFNIKKNGYANAGLYIAMWIICILSGYFVDFLEKRNYLSTIWSRKIFTTVASVGPSLGLVGAGYAGCSALWSQVSFITGMATMGFFYPSLKINPIDLAPSYAATIGAMMHTTGALAGDIAPYVTGAMTPNSTLAEWRLVFWVSFVIMSLTNIYYLLFAKADIQPWNSAKKPEPAGDK
ncbi:hypothetical protein O3M35_011366 [Rhynocoris fuscipes]|uniref:Major facilitator superfamily (MFS) profile domain-containing protein n=1 Tax=Rhynocoris fuscipes TaxID=488301 RepID=A0AAW1CY93_9HEMI